MDLRSLVWRTDLFFHRFVGEILSRQEYLVIRTPSNPAFYWGNFLLFFAPPAAGDVERWRALFRKEIAADLPVRHEAFGWDAPEGGSAVVEPFLRQGFTLSSQVGLVARHPVVAPHPAEGVRVRALEGDEDWQNLLENQQVELPEGEDPAGYAAYLVRRMKNYRRMAQEGHGAWFGAFLGKQMVGDLGLFFEGTVGRFQEVETHPLFRRRGICGTLVAEASRHAREVWGVETLVLAAERGEPAERLYLALGFRPTESLETLLQSPAAAR